MINSKILWNNLNNGIYDKRLEDIYIDQSMTAYQRKRYAEAVYKFETLFGENEVTIFSAPGRSEVCGNHTDHQHGKVLATSVNLDSIAVVSYNHANEVRFVSQGYEMITVDLSDIGYREAEVGTSKSIVKGVIKGFVDRGYQVGGFDCYTTSNVIVGAGLSSSASFEVIVGNIISGLFNEMKIDPVEIAQVSQYAENVYFGKPCGLMDQMACSIGGMIHIDFYDPAKPIVKKVDIELEAYHYSLCIVDTKGSHEDLTEDYAMIPMEMKKIAGFYGKDVLRDVPEEHFYKNIVQLREKVGDRAVLRALHFFEEEKNVDLAAEFLCDRDIDQFLKIIKRSGDSSFKYLQNVYTSRDTKNQNVSIALGLSESILKEYGVCRVHGGGFAGTIQAFVNNAFVESYKEFIETIFGEGSCHILKIRKYGGMQVIS